MSEPIQSSSAHRSGLSADNQARIRTWLTDQALPLWSDLGVEEDGGFVEQLDLDGRPEPGVDRRIRVQARQIYVFAQASLLGFGDWKPLVLRGIEWMIEKGWDKDGGGFHHKLSGAGEPIDQRKDTYDHAFVLFALAHAYRLTGETAVKDMITRTLAVLDRRLTPADKDGYLEGDPHVLPRRQNPHMHLTEACLALHEATGDSAFLERADALVDLFRRHFFNRETETLTEFFTPDWRAADGDPGQIVEPGHHFEWVYLLDAYAHAKGRAEGHDALPGAEASQLFEVARGRGLDPASGLAYDEIWRMGGVRKHTKRLWAQTEALRAHIIMARHSPALGPQADAWLDRLWRHYLEPAPAGTWLDVMGPENTPVAKAIPASTFYHLMSAFTEALAPDSLQG